MGSREDEMSTTEVPLLQLDDIQGTVLRERPMPYVGSYFLLRIDDPRDGRRMLERLAPRVSTAADWMDPAEPAWINVALTHAGLRALGVPQASLDSFAPEFQQGMAARAEILGDVGTSAPANWEPPLGTGEFHVGLILFARERGAFESALGVALAAQADLTGVSVVYRLDIELLPSGRTHFGYHDGIGEPLIEGSGSAGHPGQGPAIKAGEFILGYPDETGNLPPMPQPAVLGRNGTYLAVRKLHSRVAAFRQSLQANAAPPDEQQLLAAKLVGRWPSGAPLMLSPERDDPELGNDPERNNNFRYYDADRQGLVCPVGAHVRRVNPRDGLKDSIVDVNIHRILRRGASYGSMLPEGVLEDDGADRGIVFIFMGASFARQFEFVKSQWLNDGNFVGLDQEKDVIVGDNDGTGSFTIPARPIRRRLHGV